MIYNTNNNIIVHKHNHHTYNNMSFYLSTFLHFLISTSTIFLPRTPYRRYEILTQLLLKLAGDRFRTSMGHAQIVLQRISHATRPVLDPSCHTSEGVVLAEGQGHHGVAKQQMKYEKEKNKNKADAKGTRICLT